MPAALSKKRNCSSIRIRRGIKIPGYRYEARFAGLSR